MNAIVKNIPNALTCLNVASGVMAIICASGGTAPMWGMAAYQWAWLFIGIAAVADFADGFAARMLHAYSALGKELDSLCDLVSFGVAPAMVMYRCLDAVADPAGAWVRWLAVLIPVCGALRLAKFNTDTRQTTSFIGLPIPANAIFWTGYSAMCYAGYDTFAQWYWAAFAIIAVSWLMVSPVRLFSLKFKTWGWRGNQYRWLLVITAPVLLFCMGVPGLMWLIAAYLLYGLFAPKDN